MKKLESVCCTPNSNHNKKKCVFDENSLVKKKTGKRLSCKNDTLLRTTIKAGKPLETEKVNKFYIK